MKTISIFTILDGKFSRSITCQDDSLLSLQVSQDEIGLLDISSPNTKYFDGVNLQPKGDPPGEYYIFDYSKKQWVDPRTEQQKFDHAISVTLDKRIQLLEASDWTDTASAPDRLGEELYYKWQIYRQALRDISTQPGYPYEVIWPEPPSN